MIRINLYRKLVARLLILSYLLIGAGIGNTLFFCEETEAFSHITYKLGGNCQTDYPQVVGCRDQEVSTPQPSNTLFSEAGCRDTPIHFTHIPAQFKKLLPDFVLPDLAPTLFITVNNSPASDLEKSNLVVQLPPLQSLAALRTIVLLN